MTPVSLSGMPALVLPCGAHGALPLGMQLVAARDAEPLLFRIARAYEATTGWHTRRPKSTTIQREVS
jgi:aspartyl-tRNA(Asn)/glutamyl-tRNA(Gln) amidotransferase subunit A